MREKLPFQIEQGRSAQHQFPSFQLRNMQAQTLLPRMSENATI
jgi:hypothetical protein